MVTMVVVVKITDDNAVEEDGDVRMTILMIMVVV